MCSERLDATRRPGAIVSVLNALTIARGPKFVACKPRQRLHADAVAVLSVRWGSLRPGATSPSHETGEHAWSPATLSVFCDVGGARRRACRAAVFFEEAMAALSGFARA